MNLSDKYFSIWGVMIVIILYLLQPIAKKFDISWLKKTDKVNSRKITPDQISKLERHPIYNELKKFKIKTLRDVYLASNKKGTAQKIFILMMFRFIIVMEKDIETEIKAILTHDTRSKENLLTKLELLVTCIEKNFKKSIKDDIPLPIYNKFNGWIDSNMEWFYDSISDILMFQSNSYYDELDKYLYTSSLLLKILKKNLKDNIDTFNGEIDRLINDGNYNINDKLFSDIYFLSE